MTRDEYEEAAEGSYSSADLSTDGVSAALQENALAFSVREQLLAAAKKRFKH